MEILLAQYELVKGSRHVLLDYCASISTANFSMELKSFGHGSIRKLLVHIANTYLYWLSNFAQRAHPSYFDQETILTTADAIKMFSMVDQQVLIFLEKFGAQLNDLITSGLPGKNTNYSASPLQLFTHVITHEYHHKGQILSISRALGYVPVDTDALRF